MTRLKVLKEEYAKQFDLNQHEKMPRFVAILTKYFRDEDINPR